MTGAPPRLARCSPRGSGADPIQGPVGRHCGDPARRRRRDRRTRARGVRQRHKGRRFHRRHPGGTPRQWSPSKGGQSTSPCGCTATTTSPPARRRSATKTSTYSSSTGIGSSGGGTPTSGCAPSSRAPSRWWPCNSGPSAAGISQEELAAFAAPAPVENEELGIAAGRSPDDETAAYIMSLLLLIAMATYGQLVLTGVVQEKSSRVVEVLLARMPARIAARRQGRRHRPDRLRAVRADRPRGAHRHPGSRAASTSPRSAATCSPGSSYGSCSATPSTRWRTVRSVRSPRVPRTHRASPHPSPPC